MCVQRPTRFAFRGLQPTRGNSGQHTVECEVNVWKTTLKSPQCQGNIRSQPGSLPKTRVLCARFPSRFQVACRQNDRNVIECAIGLRVIALCSPRATLHLQNLSVSTKHDDDCQDFLNTRDVRAFSTRYPGTTGQHLPPYTGWHLCRRHLQIRGYQGGREGCQ